VEVGDEPDRGFDSAAAALSLRERGAYARYELEIDFSTIPALAERHGLRVEVPA
jgi:hypothetical protein